MRAVDCIRACSAGLVMGAWACAPATLSVDAEPVDAAIFIDGQARGTDSVSVRQPYYGVARVEAVPPPGELPAPRRTAVRMVELPPPVTSWLFPFDLLFEVCTYPWRELDTRVELESEPRQVPAQGEQPPTDELRAHALESLTGR